MAGRGIKFRGVSRYEDGTRPRRTEAFFVEAPSPMEEDGASEAPAAPPDPAYRDLPLCRDEGGCAAARRALTFDGT